MAIAFQKASELSEDLQNQHAQELLEEIEGEAQWDSALARPRINWIFWLKKRKRFSGRQDEKDGLDNL
jgi:hypothetical protein